MDTRKKLALVTKTDKMLNKNAFSLSGSLNRC
jgi:hypothetical protein